MVFEEYRTLVDEVDQRAASLFSQYRNHLRCGKGCYFCCADISVLPVEHHNMLRHLSETAGVSSAPSPPQRPAVSRDQTALGTLPVTTGESTGSCPLLGSEGECTVYPARPIICRVHGVPLAYPVYEYDGAGNLVNDRELMDLWCDLNFTDISQERSGAFFDAHGRIDMAVLHKKLEFVNESFLRSEEGEPYRGTEWLDLHGLTAEKGSPDRQR